MHAQFVAVLSWVCHYSVLSHFSQYSYVGSSIVSRQIKLARKIKANVKQNGQLATYYYNHFQTYDHAYVRTQVQQALQALLMFYTNTYEMYW